MDAFLKFFPCFPEKKSKKSIFLGEKLVLRGGGLIVDGGE